MRKIKAKGNKIKPSLLFIILTITLRNSHSVLLGFSGDLKYLVC